MNVHAIKSVVKCIIEHGAAPTKVLPIGLEELTEKAGCEGISEDELRKAVKILTEENLITSPTPGRYRSVKQ